MISESLLHLTLGIRCISLVKNSLHRSVVHRSNQKRSSYFINRNISHQTMAVSNPIKEHQFTNDFLFRQLFDRDSCTYTYVLADTNTKEAIIIDPVLELAERDSKYLKDLDLKLLYCINTHMHADHVTGTGKLKQLINGCKSVISRSSGAKADILLDADDKVVFGRHHFVARPTPGHTNGCMTYIVHEQGIAFTGDTVLIRGCGRTDFQEGNPQTLYESVHREIFSLPDHFKLYPAHDYKGQTVTTVREEKLYNARLTKTLPEFIEIMKNLNLPYPKQIDRAVPLNKICGIQE